MHDSTVHMNREPMLMPSAPSASAATRPRASANPPEAIIGISILSAAAGISTRPGISSSPGCPAHSKPSMLMPSTPRLCAFTACRTEVHLCSTLIPFLSEKHRANHVGIAVLAEKRNLVVGEAEEPAIGVGILLAAERGGVGLAEKHDVRTL